MDEQLFPAGAALIMGGTGGLGAACARELARAGSDIALCYRSKQAAAEALAEEFRALGRTVTIHAVDATDESSIAAARDAAIAAHGRVHTVVWGAGPLVKQYYLSQTPSEDWKRAVDVEVHGFFATVKTFLFHMREAGGGSFVHLGSAGDIAWPAKDGLSVAPKAANEALIKGIAREEGKYNIRANSVLIGVIDGGMFHELLAAGSFSQEWIDQSMRTVALKRWGKPQEIGYAVAFLASNRAAYTTGQQLAVAGGLGV